MLTRARAVTFLICSLLLVSCRQADGPVPIVNDETENRIGDISRGLEAAAASGESDVAEWLAADLEVFVETPTSEVVDALMALAEALDGALPGVDLTEQAAQKLLHNLWLSVAARELSERQVETLQNDVQSLLMAEGVAEENAEQVAARVGDVQNVVSIPRRWYEVF